MGDDTCPHCSFDLSKDPRVDEHRRVTFEVCPRCGKPISPGKTVIADGLDAGDAVLISPLVGRKLGG